MKVSRILFSDRQLRQRHRRTTRSMGGILSSLPSRDYRADHVAVQFETQPAEGQ